MNGGGEAPADLVGRRVHHGKLILRLVSRRLLGYVHADKMALDKMMVVIEFADRGSLLKYLRKQQRTSKSLPLQTRQISFIERGAHNSIGRPCSRMSARVKTASMVRTQRVESTSNSSVN